MRREGFMSESCQGAPIHSKAHYMRVGLMGLDISLVPSVRERETWGDELYFASCGL